MSVVVVLGMHKSGTTLVAETLHASGISMLDTDVAGGYDDGNKMERASAVSLNMDLLGDRSSESLRLIRPLVQTAVTAEHGDRSNALIAGLAGDVWGFKDPRTLLTYDFWHDVLDAPILVGVYRDPVEVFGHYVRRAGRRWISRDPLYLPDALRAWCVYNKRLLVVKRRHPEMLLLDYATLMTSDTAMQHLSAHVGRPLVDRRKPAMRRAKAVPTRDYHLARMIVRLRDGLNPDMIHSQLKKATSL